MLCIVLSIGLYVFVASVTYGFCFERWQGAYPPDRNAGSILAGIFWPFYLSGLFGRHLTRTYIAGQKAESGKQ